MRGFGGIHQTRYGFYHHSNGARFGDVVLTCEGLAEVSTREDYSSTTSATIPPGSIVGIVGGNGAGKTTLFRMIVGEDKPDGVVRGWRNGETDVRGPISRLFGPIEIRLRELTGGAEVNLGGKAVNSRLIAPGTTSNPRPTEESRRPLWRAQRLQLAQC